MVIFEVTLMPCRDENEDYVQNKTCCERREFMKSEQDARSAGHVSIPCSISLTSGQESKGKQNEYGLTTHRIALNGVYASITRLHRAIVDGVTYEVQYASPPGHANSITVLDCTLVSGGA